MRWPRPPARMRAGRAGRRVSSRAQTWKSRREDLIVSGRGANRRLSSSLRSRPLPDPTGTRKLAEDTRASPLTAMKVRIDRQQRWKNERLVGLRFQLNLQLRQARLYAVKALAHGIEALIEIAPHAAKLLPKRLELAVRHDRSLPRSYKRLAGTIQSERSTPLASPTLAPLRLVPALLPQSACGVGVINDAPAPGERHEALAAGAADDVSSAFRARSTPQAVNRNGRRGWVSSISTVLMTISEGGGRSCRRSCRAARRRSATSSRQSCRRRCGGRHPPYRRAAGPPSQSTQPWMAPAAR